MSRDEGAAEGVDRRELILAKSVADKTFVLRDVLDNVAPNCRRRTVGPSTIRRGARVKLCDSRGNSFNRVAIHLARREHHVEHPVFGQPAHLDRVFDGLGMLSGYFGSEHEGISTLKNREHSQVHPRRKARVQPHLLAAVMESIGELGTIEKRKMYRLLYLVNEITGDEDVRNVGLLEFDPRGRVRIEVRPQHRLDQRRQATSRRSAMLERAACFHHFARGIHRVAPAYSACSARCGLAPRARRTW